MMIGTPLAPKFSSVFTYGGLLAYPLTFVRTPCNGRDRPCPLQSFSVVFTPTPFRQTPHESPLPAVDHQSAPARCCAAHPLSTRHPNQRRTGATRPGTPDAVHCRQYSARPCSA